MLLAGFPSAVLGTNCYVLAPGSGEGCVIVDPGIEVLGQVAEVLRTHRLRPEAILLTHGHLDHTYSVTPLCGEHRIAAYIHEDDRPRLVDPLAEFTSSGLLQLLEAQSGHRATWAEPDEVLDLRHDQSLDLAGLQFQITHAPGHTEGSVLFTLAQVPAELADEGLARTLLTGDVLFAGAIGRTDLPGGDPAAMQKTLATRILTQPDDTLVLPGHGPATTIGQERAENPYLRRLS
ncbi:MAG: MBL fold metallo-hydrolase [Angustibacter sp.]